MRYRRSVVAALLCIGVALLVTGSVCAQDPGLSLFRDTPAYPWRGDPNDYPQIVTLKNDYIACLVGKCCQVLTHHLHDDDSDGRWDKWATTPEVKWRCNGRYSVGTVHGDPETLEDDNMPITFMANAPCHYFAYWKLKIGNDIHMIGDGASGGWYSDPQQQAWYDPTLYLSPPADMLKKEPTLGVTGPFIRGIWRTTGPNGSEIRTEIRIHLVRDLARFEYRITNYGTVAENVGFSQNGDVEVGDAIAILMTEENGGGYGPFDNRNYAFLAGLGATVPVSKQHALQFGWPDTPPVPNSFDVYDDVQNPVNATRNVLGLEDATKPDYVAIGDYNDLFHNNMWLPTDYKPDPLHIITDMTWVLCWDQKPLAPNITRTIVTYYGLAAATARWTYQLGSRSVRDSAVLAVQAPKSVRYDSTIGISPEISPSSFSVKAYIYDLATDPGPNDLRDANVTISLPPGLRLVAGVPDNDPRKPVEMIGLNSESEPIVWQVEATGEYCGELPIYVSVLDNDPSGKYWQQSVTRNIFVPAVKRSQFAYGWQLMHVPFSFNNPYLTPAGNVFGLTPGRFAAKYYNAELKTYLPVTQLQPGQAFWMFVEGLSWKQTQPFFLPDAMIVGEALGTGKQALEQRIQLYRGWNMFGNPFVYPVYWGQVLVYRYGYGTVTLDEAVSMRLLDKTLFSWNTSKLDYDITGDKSILLNPWKGYWVNARQPVTLIFRPAAFPSGDVTANPGGK